MVKEKIRIDNKSVKVVVHNYVLVMKTFLVKCYLHGILTADSV